jgi:hypothetical protein
MQSASNHRSSVTKSRTFKIIGLLAAMAMAGATARTAKAQTVTTPPAPTASAVLTGTPIDATTFNYAIDLQDAPDSANTVGTFWLSWMPGKDFLATMPLSVTSPTGWTDQITGGGTGDGFAIQWKSGSTATSVTPGSSLAGFSFTSTDTPAEIAGDSIFYPGTPVLTAFAYDAAPFSDAGDQFLVTVAPTVTPPPTTGVPLPSAAGMGLLALTSLLAVARIKRYALGKF